MTIRSLIASPLCLFISALLVVAAAIAFQPSQGIVAGYWFVAFWTTVGLDFYRTQVKEDGASELSKNRIRFAERFLGNIFVAPLFFPAHLLRLFIS